MATLFDTGERLVPTWLAASQYLNSRPATSREARNLVLEMSRPDLITASDLRIFEFVDTALRAHSNDLNVKTVAATIFPAALYKRHGRQGMYEAYKRIMARAMVEHTWGTYALRMIDWRPNKGARTINQLDATIFKLDRAAHKGHPYKSAYEVGVTNPGADDACHEFGCEVPTFHPGSEGRKIGNMPCLSHLSFKLVNRQAVDLTAIYRSHHYAARCLGNLLGLSQLLAFVAAEAKLKVGTLTCVSTHAEFDTKSWGGPSSAQKVLDAISSSVAAEALSAAGRRSEQRGLLTLAS
jgi:hypothetical protein